jgi:hypothetical protein
MNRSYEIILLGNRFNVVTDLEEDDVKRVEDLVKKKLPKSVKKTNQFRPCSF